MAQFHTHNYHDNLINTHLYSHCHPATSITALLVFDWIDARSSLRTVLLPLGQELQPWEFGWRSSIPTFPFGQYPCPCRCLTVLPARCSRHHSRRDFNGPEPLRLWETTFPGTPAPRSPPIRLILLQLPPPSLSTPRDCPQLWFRHCEHFT